MISFQIDFSILVDLIAKENELKNKIAMIGYLSQFKSNNNKKYIYNETI